MSKAKQLEQLEQECHTRGVKLIYDDLRSEGGLCRLRGSFYLILNRRLASETKARIILGALARVPERIPQPEPAVQVSTEETAPVVVDYPEPAYEEPGIGVPVAAGIPDSQS
jgi:hypothetical protein